MNLALTRAFGAVHGAAPAAALLVVSGLVSLLLGGVELLQVGFVLLAAPVSVLLLVPLASGVAVGVAAVPAAPSSLPDPPRVRLARVGWTLTWLLLAVVVTNLGQAFGADATPLAVARNVATTAGLAMLASRVDGGRHTWLPPTVLVLLSMLLGQRDTPEGGLHWWAYLLDGGTDGLGLLLAGCLLVAGLATVGSRRSRRPLVVPHEATSREATQRA